MKLQTSRLFAFALLAGFMVLSAGCFAISESHEVSIGRELHDLKIANDAGAITDEEYELLREAIWEM